MRLDKNKILLEMAKMCINQQELAIKAGISRQTLSAIMNGRNCRPEILGRVSKALETEPEQIIE